MKKLTVVVVFAVFVVWAMGLWFATCSSAEGVGTHVPTRAELLDRLMQIDDTITNLNQAEARTKNQLEQIQGQRIMLQREIIGIKYTLEYMDKQAAAGREAAQKPTEEVQGE